MVRSLKLLSLDRTILKHSARLRELCNWLGTEGVDVLLAQDTGIDAAIAERIQQTLPRIESHIEEHESRVCKIINNTIVSWHNPNARVR